MAFTKRLIKGQRLSWAEMDNNLSEIEYLWSEVAGMHQGVLAATNYVGPWNLLSGALSTPAATFHAGLFWLLSTSTANVALHEPGVSSLWVQIPYGNVSGPASAVAGRLASLDATGKVLSDSGVSPADLMPKTGGQFTGDVSLLSMNGGQLAGLRNKLINGDFSVWQRGSSFTGGVVYTADRWRLPGAAGQTATRVADHPVDGADGFCLEVVHTSGAQWTENRIEAQDAKDLVGKVVTASVYVKNIVAGPSGARLRISHANAVDNFSAATGIISSSSTTSTNWTRLSVTFTVPAGGANGIVFIVDTSLSAGASTVRVAAAQLEVGSIGTPVEKRHYALELALCQRYFWRAQATATQQFFAVGNNISTTQAVFIMPFPVMMRTVPTVMGQSGTAAHYGVQHAATLTACSAVPSFAVGMLWAGRVVATVASGLTTGQGSQLRAENTAAYIDWSAEL